MMAEATALSVLQAALETPARPELIALLTRAADERTSSVQVALDVDLLVAEIDRRITAQLDEILHAPALMALESAWRGLRFMVDRIDFNRNVGLDILSITKEELAEDFEDSTEIVRSGLYHHVYRREWGVYGGHPYALVVLDYRFGPGLDDVQLLSRCAAIGAMAHAIFVGNAAPELLGLDSFKDLGDLPDCSTAFDLLQLARFKELRRSVDTRYLGLCLPRFLLREPYRPEMLNPPQLEYRERTTDGPHQYVWGHASAAFATRVVASFIRHGWCMSIVGTEAGGMVEHAPRYGYETLVGSEHRVPTESLITPTQELELAELGLIAMVVLRARKTFGFLSANSLHSAAVRERSFAKSEAALDARVGAQLPYVFIIARLAHYLKVIQRTSLGMDAPASTLQRELNLWLRKYVAEVDNPHPRLRSTRPLRAASVEVAEVPGEPGWYQCSVSAQPHLRYMGAAFTLSLVGKLDRTA